VPASCCAPVGRSVHYANASTTTLSYRACAMTANARHHRKFDVGFRSERERERERTATGTDCIWSRRGVALGPPSVELTR